MKDGKREDRLPFHVYRISIVWFIHLPDMSLYPGRCFPSLGQAINQRLSLCKCPQMTSGAAASRARSTFWHVAPRSLLSGISREIVQVSGACPIARRSWQSFRAINESSPPQLAVGPAHQGPGQGSQTRLDALRAEQPREWCG